MPIIKSVAQKGQNTTKSDFRGPKIPPEMRVQHDTCGTICGTPEQAILDRKKLDKNGPDYTSSNNRNDLKLVLEPSRGP